MCLVSRSLHVSKSRFSLRVRTLEDERDQEESDLMEH